MSPQSDGKILANQTRAAGQNYFSHHDVGGGQL
jgi:hypothetical protein